MPRPPELPFEGRLYPGRLPKDLDGKLVGSEDRRVVGPGFKVLRIEGTGDVYTLIGSATHPHGDPSGWSK